jgi:Mg-chelatase subunit ChlD
MDLWLVQGERSDPLQCSPLGHFEFYGIHPRPAGDSCLSVTFCYNSNGIVEVEAMDITTGQALPYRLAPAQMSLEDIALNRVPMLIALVVDCSGSMYGTNINEARNAAHAFLGRAFAPRRSFAVVAFPGGLKTGLTEERNVLEAAIDSLTPIGSTPMHQGLATAREALRGKAGVQRVYLLLTDGHPDDPDATVAEATRIKRLGGRIITVGMGRLVQRDFLEGLCSSPGDYHHCGETDELEGAFLHLANSVAAPFSNLATEIAAASPSSPPRP